MKTKALLFAAVLIAGFGVRSLQPASLASAGVGWWPWAGTATVTLYFTDGRFLVPVSRRMPANDDLPRTALRALLAGPAAATGLRNPIPRGVEIRSVVVAGGVAQVDLSSAFRGEPDAAREAVTAVVQTLTGLPGVNAVTLRVEGQPIVESAKRTPLLYYASANGLMAVPAAVTTPRTAIDTYLSGKPAPELTGVPSDARLLAYDYDVDEGIVSLQFAYTPSIRTLAIEDPGRMRFVLLGLIATLTEFRDVRAVSLDFGGQTRLGLGECSDLLRTPQPRPALLNDERLLAW